MKLIFFVTLLVVGYLTGRYIEKKHLMSIRDREDRYRHIPMIASAWKDYVDPENDAQIFGGGVVVGADYFKSVISAMRGIFGGNMHNYEVLLERGRREAKLRMLEKAEKWGAEKLVNVRVETSVIGSQSGQRALPCVEIYAYGTALKKARHEI